MPEFQKHFYLSTCYWDGMTKLQCMKYTEHVECKEEMRNSHKSLVRKPERQDYARLMQRWANNIKMDLKRVH